MWSWRAAASPAAPAPMTMTRRRAGFAVAAAAAFDDDETVLRRELELFPQWCVQQEYGISWTPTEQGHWERVSRLLIDNALAQPVVAVHRDWMPRNLMVAEPGPGILDFQDAVAGPITYDLASLLRDAFISWEEEQEIDWAVRGWQAARKAGIPASRCTHAFVTLNGKVQGTYVLKEGFNAEFLRYFFKNTSGHLYDGGLHQDIHPNLECDQGDPAEKSRLTEFAAALGEPDAAKRATRIGKILDIDAYLRYLVMENIMVHGDG
jgi:hypothetical protein